MENRICPITSSFLISWPFSFTKFSSFPIAYIRPAGQKSLPPAVNSGTSCAVLSASWFSIIGNKSFGLSWTQKTTALHSRIKSHRSSTLPSKDGWRPVPTSLIDHDSSWFSVLKLDLPTSILNNPFRAVHSLAPFCPTDGLLSVSTRIAVFPQ